jgi:hypothetical protein
MKARQKLNRDLLVLAVLTSITVFTWIVLDVYRALNKPTPAKVSKDILQKLDPTLDMAVINSLKTRKFISQEELDSVPELTQVELQQKTVINLEELTASPSGQPESSPSAEVNF